MNWNIKYLPEALEDLRKLDGSQKILVRKAIQKACKNPLPENEGGYGKPLGKNNKTNLSGFLKIKLRGAGLRIVYQIVRHGDLMLIISRQYGAVQLEKEAGRSMTSLFSLE
mgnify:CR=1 FL=1